jgi:hypothetical protein
VYDFVRDFVRLVIANVFELDYKGPNFQDINQPNVPAYCAMGIEGWDLKYVGTILYIYIFLFSPTLTSLPSAYTPTGSDSTVDWYTTYCNKPGKACMLAESGSAFHVNAPLASTQLQMMQAWWQSCITNQTFLNTYPRLKVCFSASLTSVYF